MQNAPPVASEKSGDKCAAGAVCKGATGCAAGIAPTIRRFCNAITQIQIAEWYRCGISQRRTKILFADGNTKCGGKRASNRTEKYAKTPLSRVVRLRPLRQNGENIKGRAGVYLEKRSKRGGFASYCRLRLLAKVIDNVSFSCYNGLIARRMTSAPFGFPCACSARMNAAGNACRLVQNQSLSRRGKSSRRYFFRAQWRSQVSRDGNSTRVLPKAGSQMERYRSGHNEAVLKTVWGKPRKGSNPFLSARQILNRTLQFGLGFSFTKNG